MKLIPYYKTFTPPNIQLSHGLSLPLWKRSVWLSIRFITLLYQLFRRSFIAGFTTDLSTILEYVNPILI